MVCGWGDLSGIHIGVRAFGGLGMQSHPDGSSVISIFEGTFTVEGTGSGRAIFEGRFKFSASEERKKFYSTASSDQVIREQCFGDWGASDWAITVNLQIRSTLRYEWEFCIIWHSIRMLWNSVDLRRKYTQQIQDGPNRLCICPQSVPHIGWPIFSTLIESN